MAPYVLIERNNTSPKRVGELDEARHELEVGAAQSVAGQLRPGMVGADIDPAATDAILGDVCAETLVGWCAARDLRYLVRESGRPGGRHVIAVARKQSHVTEWARLCARLTRQFGVTVDNRTGRALRLLSAPHRQGMSAPVLGGTLTPRDVLEATPLRTAAGPRPSHDSRSGRHLNPGRDLSRSGREYGLACAMVRASWTADQAWSHEGLIDGKSSRKGELWWRRYVWMPAVTTVTAEQGLGEDEAWRRAQLASPVGCRKLGRDGWRGLWQRALREAKTARPRRYRIDATEHSPTTTAEIDATRRGLQTAATQLLNPVRPQSRHSIAALLHALTPAIVLRNGSISNRDLAERARLDPKTVRASIRRIINAGVLVVHHTYAGGPKDCHAYSIGPAAEPHIAVAKAETSPTSCSTPPPTGSCHPHSLHLRLTRERHHWRLRCELLASLSPGETLATSSHPLAKVLRSVWFQRRWWHSLTPTEQAARQEERRRLLRSLSSIDTSAWFHWLARREEITLAADRIVHGDGTGKDEETVARAPRTLHRGMRDPQWRTGGTPAATSPDQPELAA